MFNLVSWISWTFTRSMSLAQTLEDEVDELSDIVADITAYRVIQGILIIVSAYAGTYAAEKLINWLAEKVPLRFRLLVKQSLPLCRAFIVGLAGVLLVNMFLDLSPNEALALTGTAAVTLGFAFKDYASSLIAGIVALFERPYQVGDRVKIDEYYGEIISYGLRGVLVQTPDDDIVTIPHNKIWTEPIANANKGHVEAQTVTYFYFAHGIDVDLVMHILYRVAQTSKYTQLKFPIVVMMEEKPWGSCFILRSYPIDARDEFLYQTDLTKRAKQAFAKHNIVYPLLPTSMIKSTKSIKLENTGSNYGRRQQGDR